VNNGAARMANLTGLPATVKSLKMFVTDKGKAFKEEKAVPVTNGKAQFKVDEGTYTSLVNQ